MMDAEVNSMGRDLPFHSYLYLDRELVIVTKKPHHELIAEEVVRSLRQLDVEESILVFPEIEDEYVHLIADVCKKLGCLGVVSVLASCEQAEFNIGMLIHPLIGVYGIQYQSHIGPTSAFSDAFELRKQANKWIQKNGFADSRIEIAYSPQVFGSFLGLKIGLLINEDVYYPENARLLGLYGADIIIAVTNGSKENYANWQLQIEGHAICNGYYAIGLYEAKGVDYQPRVVAVNPEGKLICTEHSKLIIPLTVNTSLVQYARNVTEVFRQRKPRYYSALVKLGGDVE